MKGIKTHTGLLPMPVESVQKKEPYPFITYSFISPYTPFRGQGNYSQDLVPSKDDRFEYDVEETVITQPQATISIDCYSDNRENNGYDGKMEAWELTKLCIDWFKHVGYQELSDANITVVSVEGIRDRTSLIVDKYESRIGFDVTIRFTDIIKRRLETIEKHNIEEIK